MIESTNITGSEIEEGEEIMLHSSSGSRTLPFQGRNASSNLVWSTKWG